GARRPGRETRERPVVAVAVGVDRERLENAEPRARIATVLRAGIVIVAGDRRADAHGILAVARTAAIAALAVAIHRTFDVRVADHEGGSQWNRDGLGTAAAAAEQEPTEQAQVA